MTDSRLLAALSSLHDMQRALIAALPDARANQVYDARLGCLAWQLGAAVYRETYWLRERLAGDTDLTARVRHLFPDPWASGPPPREAADLCTRLPPPAHLLAWAAEIQGEHLRRLATPGALPAHPLLARDRLPWLLLQENALAYERMLVLKLLATIAERPDAYRVTHPLRPALSAPDPVELTQGHYRIGSRDDPFAYDNELPAQAVPLASFRIARRPVSNAEYLAFVDSGGYAQGDLWDAEGRAWRSACADSAPEAPLSWRRDTRGDWYAIGQNGPADLVPQDPVTGICRHEARAYAAWAARQGEAHAGAVVQHEYQWELAARTGRLEETGRAWEWCANPFHPYPGYEPFPSPSPSPPGFEREEGVLRGASLHTQPCLRRASFRLHRPPEDRACLAGVRLVYPPG